MRIKRRITPQLHLLVPKTKKFSSLDYMNKPEKEKWESRVFALVAEYEASTQQGLAVFLDERSYQEIIDFYEAEEQFERALTVTHQALGHYRFSTDFYLRQAQLLLLTNRKEEALQTLDRAHTFAPGDFELSLLRAEVLAHLMRFEESLAVLAPFKLEASQEDLSEIYLVEALVYEKREDYNYMFAALKAALEAEPRNQQALARIWLCTEYCRKHVESVTLHQWVIDQDPYSFRAWHNLGHAKAYLGDYEDAIEAYEFAFLINEDFEEAYYDFAELCFEARRFEQALEAYQDISERFGTDTDLLVRRGECFHHLGHHETARRCLEEAARIDPHNDEIFFRIGECYSAQEKWSKACEFFAKAIRMQPELEDYHSALAEASFELGDFTTAERAYREALELGPDNSRLWLDLAWFLLEMMRPDEAMNVLEEANSSLVEGELTYSYIACLFAAGRRQEALQRLSEALLSNYSGRSWLFEWVPELRLDSEILALITIYRPD